MWEIVLESVLCLAFPVFPSGIYNIMKYYIMWFLCLRLFDYFLGSFYYKKPIFMKFMETYGASGANMCSNEQIDFFKNLVSILMCLQIVSDEETL